MPNEEVMAFKLAAEEDGEPAHWMPNPSVDDVACDAATDNIDFDDATPISIDDLLALHQAGDDADTDLCDDCDDEIADML